MRVFVIGGTTVPRTDDEYPKQLKILEQSMRPLGKCLIDSNHELLVCSPYQGSADLEAIRGATQSTNVKRGKHVEFHYPRSASIGTEVTRLTKKFSLKQARSFLHLPPADRSAESLKYAWLLAQISAMERSHAILAIGGKRNGPASLLLPLAEEKRRHILPLTILGGAAEQSFIRQRYALEDRLGNGMAALSERDRIEEAIALLGDLSHSHEAANKIEGRRFFISYPRCRPQEADFIEMILRRRNQIVFRDDQNFAAGQPIPMEIDQHLYHAEVFVAIWCKEYACSPWCFDELDLALQRHKEGRLTLWLLCVDDTRVVPPAARELVNYSVSSRTDLEGTILKLLEPPEISSPNRSRKPNRSTIR
ncbi:MAG TPA: toll/interleukin-1 receptor domain-containing protein [Pyrinomonadaceae bacterium]